MASSLAADDLFNVKGLVAVITGGGSGIGLMVAKALDANGAEAVYIVGRRKDVLESAAAQARNGSVVPLVGDVTSKDSLAAVARNVEEKHGFVNVLFANAGVLGVTTPDRLPHHRRPTVKEFKDGMWDPGMDAFTAALHVNCTAVFYTVLAFLELLDAGNRRRHVAQKSQVVITGSIGGYLRSPLTGFAYSASKAAVMHLAKQLTTYFAPWKIRVNSIVPGPYPSAMTAEAFEGKEGNPWDEGMLSPDVVPLERAGSEEDMAGAALFLMSKAGAFVNGNMLITDGGRASIIPSTY